MGFGAVQQRCCHLHPSYDASGCQQLFQALVEQFMSDDPLTKQQGHEVAEGQAHVARLQDHQDR